jgi:hypothetical protein
MAPMKSLSAILTTTGIQDVAGLGGSTLSVAYGNSDGSFSAPSTVATNADFFVKAADVTGDGLPDLVTGVGKVGDFYAIETFKDTGRGSFSQEPTAFLTTNQPASIAVANFVDGNSDADLVLTSSSMASGKTYEQVSVLLSKKPQR